MSHSSTLDAATCYPIHGSEAGKQSIALEDTQMSQRFREIRLVTPVVACWCVLFAISIYVAAEGYHGRWREMRDWPEYLLFATSGVGAWMAVAWLSLYRKLSSLRLLLVTFLIAGFTYLGAFFLLPERNFNQHALPNIAGMTGVSLLGMEIECTIQQG